MRITAFFLLIFVTHAFSQDLPTDTESCAADLSTSQKPKVEALLTCLMEMQRDIDELKKQSHSMQTEIEASLDEKIKNALSKVPDEVNTSDSEPSDATTDGLISTRIIKKDQAFQMKIHETVALNDLNLVFTVNDIRISGSNGAPIVNFTWSNSKTSEERSATVKQLNLIRIEKNCTITPHKIDTEIPVVTFRSNC